jgi:UDPglucose 6-dehydrogenase
MRDAPSIAIVRALQDAGASIKAYDPEGMDAARLYLDEVSYCSDAYEVASGADCVVLVTEWNAFRSLDLGRMRELMIAPRFVDLRNVHRQSEMAAAGFEYVSIGRAASEAPEPDHRLQAAE